MCPKKDTHSNVLLVRHFRTLIITVGAIVARGLVVVYGHGSGGGRGRKGRTLRGLAQRFPPLLHQGRRLRVASCTDLEDGLRRAEGVDDLQQGAPLCLFLELLRSVRVSAKEDGMHARLRSGG